MGCYHTHTHTPVDILAQHDIRQQKPNIDRGRWGRRENWKMQSGKRKAESRKRSPERKTGYLHNIQYLLTAYVSSGGLGLAVCKLSKAIDLEQ